MATDDTLAGGGADPGQELQASRLVVAPDGTVYMIDLRGRVYCRTSPYGDWRPCSMRATARAQPPAPESTGGPP